MPKFNEFIKGFEEKEETEQPKVEEQKGKEPKVEAPKEEEPKDKGTTQTPANTFKPLSKAETEDMKKGGFTEDEYRYKQAKDWAIVMGEQIPDKRIFMQELGEWKEANKEKAEEQGQRIVNYGGKDMTLDEAKEEYKKAVAIPALKRTPKQEAYLDKSAEYDIAQDELYKKWYEEKDPQKKAELKEQMDTLDKEYARFLNEWEEAERNRYKKD